jgi:UDP-N-acetylglucosamine 2-epimerase (non-hydrolysing)
MGYIDFLALQASSAAVLTDSGGIQEETTVLGVPCLTLREETERPVTVTEGTNLVVGRDKVAILDAIGKIATGGRVEPRRPRLWDGKTAQRIVRILEESYGCS